MSLPPITQLDFEQAITVTLDEANRALRVEDLSLLQSFDSVTGAIKVEGVAGSLVPQQYNEIVLTYVPSGNGVGQIYTATYKLASSTIATLTLTYDSSNRLIDVLRS